VIVVRRLAPGDDVITNASNEPAMALYESVGGVRPNDDDVMWDFGYEAR
jgi:hypothetical protein